MPAQAPRQAPSVSYYAIFMATDEGEFVDAGDAFVDEGRGAIKTATTRWIDSICYHAMTGECYYQMGQLTKALDHFTSALQLFLAYSDWMNRIQNSGNIVNAPPGSLRNTPWGVSGRRPNYGKFPDTMLIALGRIDNNDVIRQGGVVQAPVLYSIDTVEIVRCTALAMRRRRELLGPTVEQDKLARDLVAKLTLRPAPTGHWLQTWIDVQLGLAYAGIGRDDQAKTLLEKSLVIGGTFDHPLTHVALFELGRIALVSADYPTAATCFAEATFGAAQYGDALLLEEAFRYGFMTHVASSAKGAYPPLELAATWAQQVDFRQGADLSHLLASLRLCLAENAALLGDSSRAASYWASAEQVLGRSDMAAGTIGARSSYLAALLHYQDGNVAAGDSALASALAYQQGSSKREAGSLWLFHLGLTDALYSSGNLAERQAAELYAHVLREPTSLDWEIQPLESITALATPHAGAMERWFDVTLARKEVERALEISDLSKRHRLFSSLTYGGRLNALRWVLDAPPELLGQTARLQRQNLLVRYPVLAAASQESRQIRAELAKLPVVPADPAQFSQQKSLLEALGTNTLNTELALREIAVRREPCDMGFPPLRSTGEIQSALGDGQTLLVYYSTSKSIQAFVITKDKEQYGTFTVGPPARIHRYAMTLLRDLGHYEGNKQIKFDELSSNAWKKSAAELYKVLFNTAKTKLPPGTQELIIVPDGPVWYVPFECLQMPEGEETVSLISKYRIRYSPFAATAVPDPLGRSKGGTTGVALGRLFPQDDDAVSRTAFDALSQEVPGAVALAPTLAGPSALYSSLLENLVVFDDVPLSPAYAWAPLPMDKGPATGSLSQWMSLPCKGPETICLPGFHTAAESALKGQSWQEAGYDLFYPICGLMASGARTVLISRWRPGGQTSYDLVREFVRETSHATASDAWQRSALLAMETPIKPELEPRIRLGANDAPPKAEHPFFWAGYMVIDTGIPAVGADAPPAAGP